MKQPANQNQHKVPQVYLKQFGYKFHQQDKVSVLKLGEKFIRQKSIESFLAETNIYDIKSEVPEIERIFEGLNCDIENEYNDIIADLENEGRLSEKSYAVLLQLIPNFIARSDSWRAFVIYMLESDVKENFLKVICVHLADSFEDLETKDFFRVMVDGPVEEAINRALMLFTDHLLRRIGHYEIVIIQAQDGKPWFTSDNPIVLENRTGRLEIMKKESEIYFPINPKYLAYLHYRDSDDKVNELRGYNTNEIYIATDDQNFDIQQKIMANAHNYVIFEGEFKYTFGNQEFE
ncbi:DUF4238 domain-containing protein [Flavobacteriaceae bacterium 3-367]